MVKVRAVRLHPIVTGHAVCAECQKMFGGEYLVILQMAVAAGILIKWRSVPFYMAILAGKICSI